MFNHLIKIKPTIVPLYHLTNKRYFVSSSFISQNKKDDGENNKDHVDTQQNDAVKNHKNTHQKQHNKDAKNNQNKSQEQQKKDDKHDQHKPQEKQSTEPSLEDQLKECNSKYKKLQDSYLLSLADQENLRQRTIREVNNAKEFGIQKFAKDILDTIDILGMALNSVPEEFQSTETSMKKDSKELSEQLVNLYKGVSMTETELQKTLKRHGVEKDDPIDQEFDPNRHEAVFQAPMPDKKPGTVFVVQKVGYLLKNRVLRPAQVGVVAET